jgi:hypothetical protein
MPVFYFHVRRGDEFIMDEEGVDLPNLAIARQEAILGARGIMAAGIGSSAKRSDAA